jgi:uncharacterized repeat protein (TIGR03843 family)
LPEVPPRARGQGRSRGSGRPARGRPARTSGPAAGPQTPAGEDSDDAALQLLAAGTLDVQGRLAVASNETFFCELQHEGQAVACVYKPVAGERPLWDFPTGTLAGREVAAYQVSCAGGWNVVPPTVYRDGPFGPGMCQLWIDTDPAVDVIALARRTNDNALRAMSVFDAVVNNADRKIGHLLPAPGGRLYGCDHGVCFGEEYKLRTVLWQWRGKPLPGSAISALERLTAALEAGPVATVLAEWLSPRELDATRQRADLLLRHKVHPFPPEDWPAVPWPPV